MTFGSALPGVRREIGPFAVTPFELPHPQGCLGYRIEAGGRSFVYATDVELSVEGLSPQTARFFEGADALCLDAQYTPDEYAGRGTMPRKGWGHSTMVDAARIAEAVGARRLYLFHHDPAHNDEVVASMAEQARDHFRFSEPAREGATVQLPRCA
jgi:ribonuclease BN (tRNA processing enzyme)